MGDDGVAESPFFLFSNLQHGTVYKLLKHAQARRRMGHERHWSTAVGFPFRTGPRSESEELRSWDLR